MGAALSSQHILCRTDILAPPLPRSMENHIPRQFNVYPGVDSGAKTTMIGSSNQLSQEMLPNPWFQQQLFTQPVAAGIEVVQTSQSNPNFQAEISCQTKNDHKRKRNYGKADDEGNGKTIKLDEDFVKIYLEPLQEKVRSQEQTIDRLMKMLKYIMRRCFSSNPPDPNIQKPISEVLELWEENTQLRAGLALMREEPIKENYSAMVNHTTPVFPPTYANQGPPFYGRY